MLIAQQILAGLGSRAPATIAYVSQNSNEANQASYTFTAQSIGTAASDRFILVGVYAPANTNFGNITGVTIGGSPMTQLVQTEDASGFSDFAVYGLSVPSGTTADIVVSLSGSPDRLGIDVFRANSLSSTTPTATATLNTASVDLVQSITVQSGGIIIGFAGNENTATLHTWTNLTERHDDAIGTGGSSMTGAADAFATGQTPSITMAPVTGQSRQALMLVAMR